MKRLTIALAAAALLAALAAPPAQGAFGFKEVDVTFTNKDGSIAVQAGAHPFAMTTTLAFNTIEDPVRGQIPAEDPKDLTVAQIPGFVGAPEATPRCTSAVFLSTTESCPANTVIGETDVGVNTPGETQHALVYNIVPPPGVAAKLGFEVLGVPITVEAGLNPNPPYNVLAKLTNISQVLLVYGSELTLWGNPADPAHDAARGGPAGYPERAFLTLPRACEGPLPTRFRADSWQNPGVFAEAIALTHDEATPPNPLGFSGCGKLSFAPSISAQPTTEAAESPTGLDFELSIADSGIANPDAIAGADLRAAHVTLPVGMTANPSLADGLEACSEAQLAQEGPRPDPARGCPQASKVGTVAAKTPLLAEEVSGSLFLATPNQNPAGSLIALYMVIRNPTLGIIVTQTLEVRPDPATGRLETIATDLPQVPVSDVRIHLREGARSPLISPPRCGSHEVRAELFPSSGNAPTIATSAFELISGPGGAPCPPGGTPPFGPGFQAGSLNDEAGAHTPFYMRLTRRDGDQGLVRFAATLPPGLTGTLAGVSRCPDAAIAAAAARSGLAELAAPSCPANSELGDVQAGAGVGSQLIYVPGHVYLAGPYNGAPLSVVAIVPAVAGPFDVGTVVVRQALDVDPRSAQVQVDGSRSDPIPRILAGIPLRVRDIRVNVDRPNFTLNPTSCDPFAIDATLWADEGALASLKAPFQAANCASLPFGPKLGLRLAGGTRRGDHPALRAIYRGRPGDANVRRLALTLPRSEFVENANFRTICTRVQFAAEACPAGSVYGHVRAFTPLLDEPLEGPVYLRSSDHPLPDAVFALHGLIDAEVAVRIDSVGGRLRATVASAPDVPVSKVIVQMQSGRKGLIVNSRGLCAAPNRAKLGMVAQSGRRAAAAPVLVAKGCKGR